MADRAYWRVHVRVDEDPLSTLTFTCPSAEEDRAEVGTEALRAHAELVGLPEGWTVHVEVSTLTGPGDPQDKPGSV
jgi:hypothetical protein